MAITLALITSALWGSSDFFGGLATRREPVARVMLWAHLLGLVAIVIAAPLLAERFLLRDFVLGGVAGLVGLLGLVLLYRGLSTGPMAVIAPLSALTAALVPVLWGLGSLEPLSILTLLGLLVGLLAVVAISWSGNLDPDGPPITARAMAGAAVAGVCFGSIVLIFDQTAPTSAPWPIVGGRLVTTCLLVLFAVGRKSPLAPGSTLGLAALAGLGDTAANVTLLWATSAALGANELSVVAVLTAFYPAATVVWARALLGERFGPIRVVGLGLGLVAVGLLTVS